MWTYVVCIGFGMLIDPVRIGIAAILMSRRRAIVNLLAFWVGGMIAGITIGIAVLILLHDVALVAIESAASTINEVRSAVIFLTGDHIHITVGVLALSVLAVMLIRDRARIKTPVTVGGSESSVVSPPSKLNLLSAIGATIHRMLERGLVWPAFVVGFMSTFPPIEGPMALTVIMGSRTTAGMQFSAFILFTLMVLAFIEIPLVSYLAAPQKTEAAMLQMTNWITAHRRQLVQTVLAVMGAVSVAKGLISL